MANRDSKSIIKKLEADGWWSIPGGKGSHTKMTNGEKKTTVPNRKDMSPEFVKDLEKQTGVKLL